MARLVSKWLVSRSAVLFLSALLSLAVLTEASAKPFTKLVVFGDSLSDTGNLFAATGGAIPPSPAYFEGRFSNGPIWVDFLASELELPVENFAVGGALTGRVNEFDNPGIPAKFPGLLDEIGLFVALHPFGADPDALYVVWAGANDFRAAPSLATISTAITNLVTAASTLAALGARHILVPNMPDLGLTPEGLASGFSSQLTALSGAFNGALKMTLSSAVPT